MPVFRNRNVIGREGLFGFFHREPCFDKGSYGRPDGRQDRRENVDDLHVSFEASGQVPDGRQEVSDVRLSALETAAQHLDAIRNGLDLG